MTAPAYVFLFDIDMVLADWRPGRKFVDCDKPDWPAYYQTLPDFPVIPAGAVLFNFLVTQSQIIGHAIQAGKGDLPEGAEIPYVDVITCRPERTREATMNWFVANALLAPRQMHMREDMDGRPHHLIKLDMYRKHYEGKEEALILFEDNADTIRAFRDIGVTVYQTCASGLN